MKYGIRLQYTDSKDKTTDGLILLRSCLNLIAEIYYSRFFDGFVLEMREHTGGM